MQLAPCPRFQWLKLDLLCVPPTASSAFGAEMDSLCDLVDFGVSPAIVVYLWYGHLKETKIRAAIAS